jgi:hypothetical protein
MSWAGWEDFVPPAGRTAPGKAKRAKYGNKPTQIGSFTFASKREANRFEVLSDELVRGLISHFGLQPEFQLHAIGPDGVSHVIGRYIADFTYRRNGQTIFEDAKGMRTPLYKWKKKHTELEYAVEIVEV